MLTNHSARLYPHTDIATGQSAHVVMFICVYKDNYQAISATRRTKMEKAVEERLSMKIDQMLEKINTDPNPEELEAIKKMIKQKVPFTRRGYFAAVLLKALSLADERGPEKKKGFEKDGKDFRAKDENRKPNPAVKREVKDSPKKISFENDTNDKSEKKEPKAIPEGAKTIYLNIGKMKHLYGNDISKLLQSEIGVTRADIYAIRVHDRYSFITMSEENCQKAIDKINGMEIKGRDAQVSFAKS